MSDGLLAGAVFAGLRIERQIATGGMGSVYLAVDPTLHRRVALKVVAEALAEDARYRDRFLVEAQLAASLEHSAIVPVYAAGEIDGRLYLVMRYVDGGTLGDRLEASGRLAPAETIHLLRPISDALDTAHRAGLVHRDVKPANILLQADQALLADFGLAASAAPGENMLSDDGLQVSGTMGYLAPEQIEGDRAGAATDQYALACVLFECLSGQKPFPRGSDLAVIYAHLQEPPPSLVQLRPELPRAVDAVMSRGLAKHPAERYGSCRELVDTLAVACRTPFADAAPPRRRRARAVLVAAAVTAAVAAAAAVPLTIRHGEHSTPSTSSAPSDRSGVGLLDAETGKLLATIPLGQAPSSIAVGAGSVWVLDADDRTISQVDPKARAVVRTFSTASTPTDVAAGAGAVWIGNGFLETESFGGYPKSVSRLDPGPTIEDRPIALPRAGTPYFPGGEIGQHVAVTRDAVWVVNPDQTVSRIDPVRGRVVESVDDVHAIGIAAGDPGVWVLERDGVAGINTTTHSVSQRIPVAAESLATIAVGAGGIWVTDPFGGSVWRIEPGPKPLLRQIPLEFGVTSIAATDRAIWATNSIADKVYRIDPRTNRAQVVNRMAAPGGVAVGADGVWVTTAGRTSIAGPLPRSSCSDVDAGNVREPSVMLVSDLPLQGQIRPVTAAMVAAIHLVLQQRGFKAGRYTVGYQSCDDSTAQTGGSNVYRCALNAKAYARHLDIVGLIGAYHSSCSAVEIPVTNTAPNGPLAMISPSNTLTFLTRRYPGMRQRDLDDLYPTGERNYVRIAAADHLASVAQVEFARQLHRKRLFVIWDGADPYAAGFAESMRQAARRLGLEVVGAASWDPQARRFADVARRIARGNPDAVLIAGARPSQVGAFVHDLRAGLGPEVALIANDGFADGTEVAAAAGSAAAGMYFTNYGLPDSELPPSGRSWLAEFQKARGGDPAPSLSATYAAQAMEILLDAVARSDGTRASVTRELRRTHVRDGILGDIRFDEFGDLVEGPVTVFRIVGNGAVIDRVLTVRSASGG